MPKSTAERVRQTRDRHRDAGLRPVQVWVPDTRAPGFAEMVRRQCQATAAAAVRIFPAVITAGSPR